jgi:hypothetical protein
MPSRSTGGGGGRDDFDGYGYGTWPLFHYLFSTIVPADAHQRACERRVEAVRAAPTRPH